MLQIAMAVGPLVIAFGARDSGGPVWWVLATTGLLLIVFAIVMERIRQGIENNARELGKFGTAVGDHGLPQPRQPLRSIAFYVSLVVFLLGVAALVVGVATALGMGE